MSYISDVLAEITAKQGGVKLAISDPEITEGKKSKSESEATETAPAKASPAAPAKAPPKQPSQAEKALGGLQTGAQKGLDVAQRPLDYMGETGARIREGGKSMLGGWDQAMGQEAGKGHATQIGKLLYNWALPTTLGGGALAGLSHLFRGGGGGGGILPSGGGGGNQWMAPLLMAGLGAGGTALFSKRNKLRNAVLAALLGAGGGMAYNAMSTPPSLMQRLSGVLPFKR